MIKNDGTKLTEYGWDEAWLAAWKDGRYDENIKLQPARVVAQFSHDYRIVTASGERLASVTGKFEFTARSKSDFPAVGDWVAAESDDADRGAIHAVLPRRSAMTRRAAGSRDEEQIIGANLDDLFIVNALNGDWNLRRIERYLVMAWESGANPVVLLTKSDLCPDCSSKVDQVREVAPGVPVHAVSAVENRGREQLASYLKPGRTVAVTGMSGVGKSTLLNWLAEEERQTVQGIREDDARGRHTTTHRELFLLPSGGLLLDTPGMRELRLWDADDGWQEAFADIEELARGCRFRDCRHRSEAGCAVLAALEAGELDAKRLANYMKTEKELARLARKERATLDRRERSGSRKEGRKGKQGRQASKALVNDYETD